MATRGGSTRVICAALAGNALIAATKFTAGTYTGSPAMLSEAIHSLVDTALAAERAHLTTAQAGELARKAVVGRVEPFHFSPRYAGDEAFIIREVEEMFRR